MFLDCRQGDDQARGDLLIGSALCQQAQGLLLATGERFDESG
jgi:hypothetical protein